MNKGETSSMAAAADSEDSETATAATVTTHHLTVPPGLTQAELQELVQSISEFHTYQVGPGQCSSLLAQRIHAPLLTVWSVVRRFDRPQTYKHFIKSCYVGDGFEMRVGCLREVNVISGLPAETSTERLDILDDERHVTGFSIIGGEHRLRNYRSVTTVHEYQNHGGEIWTVVLESYVVDVPEGNTEEDTRLFADTVVKLNLQKLASVTEGLARDQHFDPCLWVQKKTSFKRDGDRCFFCKKKGHIKKDCAKFKAWLSKREPTGIHKPEEAKSR